MKQIEERFFRSRFPERKKDAHKGDFGRVLIFAGSCGMAGAAILAGRAALRCGAGLVRFLIPSWQDPIYPILQSCVPEATCIIPEKIGFYGVTGEADPRSLLQEYSAIAAGSGLGDDAARMALLRFLVQNYAGTLVLDADGLNAAARGDLPKAMLLDTEAQLILTPHVGEAKRLLSAVSPEQSVSIRTEQERLSAVRRLSDAYQCTVLLKGSGTLITSPGGEVLRNPTGGPGMATGGSGDVLSGMIAAFAGQGLRAEEAAACGAWLHGKAGDLAAKELGEVCMNAGDLVRYLPGAFRASEGPEN